MKNQTGIVIGAVVVVLVIIGVLVYQKNKEAEMPANNNVSGKKGGSVYVGVTDVTADIKNVNDINLSVRKIEMHSAESGWITVSSSEKTFALLFLKANKQVKLYIKKDNVPAGSYDRVRITLGDIVVRTKNKGDIKATIPSSQIVMNTNVVVRDNQNTHIKLDFLADKSLHMTSDGKFVFAPVLRVESRSNASVNIASDETVIAEGGTINSDINIGVDLNGSSKTDFQLNTDNSLKIESNVGDQIKFMLKGNTFTSDTSKVRENEGDEMSADVKSDTEIKGSNGGSINTNLNGNVNLTY